MKISGFDGSVKGFIDIPGDKSISHRAIILSSIGEGISEIEGLLYSDDVTRTIKIFKDLGVDIYSKENKTYVLGRNLEDVKIKNSKIDCGNSGTTMRLIAGVLAGLNNEFVLYGDDSLNNRPMNRIIKPLSKMGISMTSNNGKAPIFIKGGNVNSLSYDMEVESAQVKSAIMLAALNNKDITKIKQLGATRDHTEKMLKHMEADICYNYEKIYISGKNKLKNKNISIPGDISSAAYFIVLATIFEDSYIKMKNIGLNETRTGIIEALLNMGADIKIKNKLILNNEPRGDLVIRGSKLKGIIIDAELVIKMIDEIPILAIAAVFAEGETIIKGLGELKNKETDRLNAIYINLKKAGVNIKIEENALSIKGFKDLKPIEFKTFNDHRIAMAMSIFALKINGESIIDNTECINISFPGFFDTLYNLLKN